MLEPASRKWTEREAAHLLNRAGFGGPPADLKRFFKRGRAKAVRWLVHPTEPVDRFPAPDWTGPEGLRRQEEFRDQITTLRRESAELSPEEAEEKRRKVRKQLQRRQRESGVELQGWWLERMAKTEAPLREKMTLFWHDHFPSSIRKVRNPRYLYLQNALFREFATGSFKELTHRIALDPAMVTYLDTAQSRKGKPNENFARELMELFTLGEGNYTEQDIKEAARAFTGYTLNRRDETVRHQARQWDDGEKTFLGKTGHFSGGDIVNILFEQRACARYLPRKLWEFFVYEKPSRKVIDELATVFAESGFEVAPVLERIFLSREFYSERAVRTRIKSPVEYLVQMFRQLELEVLPRRYLIQAQIQLGQQLLMPPNVAGWDWGQAWINTNSLLSRYNVAGYVTKGSGERKGPRKAGRKAGRDKGRDKGRERWTGPDYGAIAPPELRADPARLARTLAWRFFQDELPAEQRRTFEKYAASKNAERFTDPEVAELVHLMMSTPQYQLS